MAESVIVVFISPKFNDADKEKIAESMRIHKITTTNDKNLATVILEPNLQKTYPNSIPMVMESAPKNLTLADIAQIVIDETHGELFKLKESLMMPCIPAPVMSPKKSHHNKAHKYHMTKIQFNNSRAMRTQICFDRNKHK